jgi:hypothetical protein
MRRLLWFALALTVAVCMNSLPARASVIYSNLNSGSPTYDCCDAYVVNSTEEMGFQFTAVIGGPVSQVDVGLSTVASGNVTVSLWTDGDGVPGTQLGSWNVASPAQIYGSGGLALTTISDLAGPSLTAGQTYFLAISVSGGTDIVWNWNTGASGPYAWSSNGGTNWSSLGSGRLGAFDILGASSGVPEPATFLLLGSGVLCVLLRPRKRAAR